MSDPDAPKGFMRLTNSRRRSAPAPAQQIAFLDHASVPQPPAPIPPKAFDFDTISDVTCFVAGTRIRTPQGDVPIETLQVGDEVVTRDRGPQAIRWIGTTQTEATPDKAPIEFVVGAQGNKTTLRVSPNHRMLLAGWRCATIAGTKEALTPARHLINDRDVRQILGGTVTYLHMAFDQHEIITADGIASESFHPDAMSLHGLSKASRAELQQMFPAVTARPASYGPMVRPEVKPDEARLIRP